MIRPALTLLVLFTLLTGAAYPALVTGMSQVLFPREANGSLITKGGNVVGSSLIGQPFDDPKYFFGRASNTAPMPYNAGASTGSNLGPLNPALKDAVSGRVKALQELDPTNSAPVPVELVTTSGSGLDPHISPGAAEYQAARVARVRGLDVAVVKSLIGQHTEGRTLGVLGEPRVNVLELNLALDAKYPVPAGSGPELKAPEEKTQAPADAPAPEQAQAPTDAAAPQPAPAQ
jgi:K+-transporting ATPase ATPase C chain